MKTRLEEIIKRRGLERKIIARDLEIERRTLDNYINEVTLMNSDIITKLAKYLNVSTDYLLGVDTLEDEFLNDTWLVKLWPGVRVILAWLVRD